MTPRPELWQHRSGARYIVLRNAAGVQAAAGPFDGDELREIQADEWCVPWSRRAREWVREHEAEFKVVW